MMKKIIYFLTFTTLVLFAGCGPVDKFDPVYPPQDASRVLFVYMAIDEFNISSAGLNNITEMVAGATVENMNAGQIVVFCDSYGSNSQLIRIFSGTDGKGHQETLINYGEDLDSSDPATLSKAFQDMKKYVTGTSYALAFGSHGTGWMPASMHEKYQGTSSSALTISGYSYSEYSEYERIIPQFGTRAMFPDTPTQSWMELSVLAETVTSLQSDKFDYIIFDLCYMGGVEVAYAMRNATDKIVFSPAEVLLRGMPYHKVMPDLFATVPRLGDDGVCADNIAFFKTYSASDTYNSATMTLVDCTKFDRFASVMEQIIGTDVAAVYDRSSTADLPYYDRNSIHTMFDIKEFVKALKPDAALLAKFEAALDELVVSKQTTGRIFELQFDMNRYSGLTTYVPLTTQDDLLKVYKNTEWFKRAYPL